MICPIKNVTVLKVQTKSQEEYGILIMTYFQKIVGAVIVILRLGHTENGPSGEE